MGHGRWSSKAISTDFAAKSQLVARASGCCKDYEACFYLQPAMPHGKTTDSPQKWKLWPFLWNLGSSVSSSLTMPVLPSHLASPFSSLGEMTTGPQWCTPVRAWSPSQRVRVHSSVSLTGIWLLMIKIIQGMNTSKHSATDRLSGGELGGDGPTFDLLFYHHTHTHSYSCLLIPALST